MLVLLSSQGEASLPLHCRRLYFVVLPLSGHSLALLVLCTLLPDVVWVAVRLFVQPIHEVISVRVVQRRRETENLDARNFTSLITTNITFCS